MMELAPSVRATTQLLMDLLDRHCPKQLKGFYLVGSVALGDYHQGQSDVDFVAILDGRADPATLAYLHAQLAQRYPTPHCDGIYLRLGELAAPPQGTGIEARAGRIDPASGAERHPVTWLTLADAGIALRGPEPTIDWVAADRQAAIEYSRANMQTYWRNWMECRREVDSHHAQSLDDDDAIVWGALGVARLHATIANGRVPSKTAAGINAQAAFPAHAQILTEAIDLRRHSGMGSAYTSRQQRRRDLIAFMDAVLQSSCAD